MAIKIYWPKKSGRIVDQPWQKKHEACGSLSSSVILEGHVPFVIYYEIMALFDPMVSIFIIFQQRAMLCRVQSLIFNMFKSTNGIWMYLIPAKHRKKNLKKPRGDTGRPEEQQTNAEAGRTWSRISARLVLRCGDSVEAV